MRFATAIILILNILFSHSAFLQFLLKGIILDEFTKKPLSNATVNFLKKDIKVLSDNEGHFMINSTDFKRNNIKIKISYIGYETKELKVHLSETNLVQIWLTPTDTKLGEITITPDLMRDIFFGSKETQVLDYVFFQSGWLIALYNFFQKKTYFVYVDRNKNILFEKEFVNSHFQNFYVSCIDIIYAECGNEVDQIDISNEGIECRIVNYDYFNNTIKYYVGKKDDNFYITKFPANYHYLYQGFFIDDTKNKKVSEFPFAIVIREKDMILLQLSEDRIKFVKIFEGLRSRTREGGQIDVQVDGGWSTMSLALDRAIFRERVAYQYYMFKEDFAPLYVLDSNVILINYYENIIERFRFDGRFLDTIPLKVSNNHKEIKQTYFDQLYKKVYYRSEHPDTSQSIYELNINTGEGKELINIKRKDIYNVKVSKGYVYYLFNPPMTNNVFLLRKKMGD